MVREYSSLLGSPRLRRLPVAAMCVLAATSMVTGCGVLNGSSGSDSSSNQPEMTLKIGANPSSVSVPLYIAMDKGLFDQQHLKVQVITTTGGAVAVPAMVGGSYDITSTNDATAILADAKGTSLKFVFDGIAATPSTFTVDTLPNSGINSIHDLENKTVGVSSLNDPTYFALQTEMTANNVNVSKVHFTAVPFANAQEALKTKQVDATVETEPYKTQNAQQIGSRPVVDVFGDTSGFANFPIAAWVTTTKYATGHAKEIAAFQKAMVQAAGMANNQATAKASMLKHTKIAASVADVMSLPRFPSDLDPNRLARVVYMLRTANLLKPDFQIESMILPLPPAS